MLNSKHQLYKIFWIFFFFRLVLQSSLGWLQILDPLAAASRKVGKQAYNYHTRLLEFFKITLKLGLVVHACNPSTWKGEAG